MTRRIPVFLYLASDIEFTKQDRIRAIFTASQGAAVNLAEFLKSKGLKAEAKEKRVQVRDNSDLVRLALKTPPREKSWEEESVEGDLYPETFEQPLLPYLVSARVHQRRVIPLLTLGSSEAVPVLQKFVKGHTIETAGPSQVVLDSTVAHDIGFPMKIYAKHITPLYGPNTRGAWASDAQARHILEVFPTVNELWKVA